jgi:hypothetical protein
MPNHRHSPQVMKLSVDQLRDIIDGIRDILWLDLEGDQDVYNPEKDWDLDTLECAAGTLEHAGLRPARTEDR